MVGRYGSDDFGKFLMITALVLLIVSMFFGRGILFVIALAVVAYSYYRMLSRDFGKRAAENSKYREVTAGVRRQFRIWKRRFSDRKEYRYFRCPTCSQEVRVPKGKGHIRITCPKCKGQFDRSV